MIDQRANGQDDGRVSWAGDGTVGARKEGISPNLYYNWSKEFLEAGKRRLQGDTKRQATSPEVTDLREETASLKELVADLSLRNAVLKKMEELDARSRGR